MSYSSAVGQTHSERRFVPPHNKLYRALFLFPMHATGGFFDRPELELEFFCERLLYQRQPSIVVDQIYCLFLSLFKLNSSTLLATCTTSCADKKSVAN